MSTLRAGVIGLGVGEQHIRGYADAGCEVAVICDFDENRLAEVAARNPGPRTTTHPEEVLADDLDVVSIATWDNFHHDQVVGALATGKHVFVEKPICLSLDEARAIRAALARAPELRLSSNLPLRGSPRFVQLRELVRSGALGTPYYAEADYLYGRRWKITRGWRGKIPFYSVVHGGAVHLVDLLHWVTGDRVVEVTASGSEVATRGTQFRYDDVVVATLVFESGLMAKVSSNYSCVHPHFHAVKVFGTTGTFVNGMNDAALFRREDDAAEIREERLATAYPGIAKSVLIPPFVDAIRDGTAPPVTVDEIFETMAVCFAIEAATDSRGTVAVDEFRT